MGNKKKAVFITFEGAEGCGKSTHARLLCAFLRRVGFKVLALREPGSTRLGEALRTLLLHKDYEIPAEAELFLYEAARSQLIHEKILPNMYAYDCIICDRFQDATFVYQAYAGGVDRRFVDKVGGYVVRHAAPEATIIFDVPVAVSMRRIVKPDRIERKPRSFHKKLREGYRYLARKYPKRVSLVDSTRPIARVQRDVREKVLALLIAKAGR